MKYDIVITTKAERQIRQLERPVRTRIIQALDELSTNPRPVGSIKLRGVDAHRLRVGDYRIVYAIDDVVRIITIVRVGHRREVYR